MSFLRCWLFSYSNETENKHFSRINEHQRDGNRAIGKKIQGWVFKRIAKRIKVGVFIGIAGVK